MAHFAKLETVDGVANVVTQVVVVANADTADANGVEKEYIGAAWLERTVGGVWKQTSYNNNIRKRYAGLGYTYNAEFDAFIPPKPYPSWVFNEETLLWDAPVAQTDEQIGFVWNEESGSWIEPTYDDNPPIPTKPYPSWIYNEEKKIYQSPVPPPDDFSPTRRYTWNEEEQSWELVVFE